MNNQDLNLVMKEYPLISGFIGLVFLIIGIVFVPSMLNGLDPIVVLLVLATILIGLGLLSISSVLTITADRVTQVLTLDSRSLVKKHKREIPFSQIAAIELEMHSTRAGSTSGDNQPTYRIVVVMKDGQSVPFRSTYTSGSFR